MFVINYSMVIGMRNNIRIVYMGTTEFSSKILSYLLEQKVNIVGVVSQPDKEVGRKRILTPSPVKELALKNGVRYLKGDTYSINTKMNSFFKKRGYKFIGEVKREFL